MIFQCPRCSREIPTPSGKAGQVCFCPSCKAKIRFSAKTAADISSPPITVPIKIETKPQEAQPANGSAFSASQPTGPTLRIECPQCPHVLEVGEAMAGQLVWCPKCRSRIVCPAVPASVNRSAFSAAPPPARQMPTPDFDEPRSIERRTKPCPFCAEEVLEEAKKCKHCGEIIDVVLREQSKSPLSAKGEPELFCPKCGSNSLSANKKGFGLGKAAAGAVLLGPVGLLGGLIGSGTIKVTCLSCGEVFEPGQLIGRPPPKSHFKTPEEIKKEKAEAEDAAKAAGAKGCMWIIVGLVILFLIGTAMKAIDKVGP